MAFNDPSVLAAFGLDAIPLPADTGFPPPAPVATGRVQPLSPIDLTAPPPEIAAAAQLDFIPPAIPPALPAPARARAPRGSTRKTAPVIEMTASEFAARYGLPDAPAPAADASVPWSDYATALKMGLYDVPQALGGLGAMAGVPGAEGLRDWAGQRVEDIAETMSPQGKAAMARELATEDPDATLGYRFQAPTWAQLGLNIARAAPATAAMAVPTIASGGAAGALAAGAAGRAALARGATELAAKELAKKAGARAGAVAAGTTGGITEGGLSAGATAAEIEQQIMKAPLEQLAQTPEYRERLEATDAGLPDDIRSMMARRDLAKAAAKDSALWSGLAVGLLSVGPAATLGRLVRGGAGTGVRAVAKGAVTEAVQETLAEAPQSAVEQMAQNLARRRAGEDVPLSQGALNAALVGGSVGAILGGATGGAGAAVGARGGRETPARPASAAPPRQQPATPEEEMRRRMAAQGGEDAAAQAPAGEGVTARNDEISDAQKAAGNYPKRKLTFQGLPISIETEAGDIRRSKPGVEPPWEVRIPAPYGYIRGTDAADSTEANRQNIDVYVGPDKRAPQVFVFDQIDPETGKFDEHKVMVGFAGYEQATAAYDKAFSDGSGPDRIGAVTTLSMRQFKGWLKNGDQTKPMTYVQKPNALRNGLKRLGYDAHEINQMPRDRAVGIVQRGIAKQPAAPVQQQTREQQIAALPPALTERLRRLGYPDDEIAAMPRDRAIGLAQRGVERPGGKVAAAPRMEIPGTDTLPTFLRRPGESDADFAARQKAASAEAGDHGITEGVKPGEQPSARTQPAGEIAPPTPLQRRLAGLGYRPDEIAKLKPDQAAQIAARGIKPSPATGRADTRHIEATPAVQSWIKNNRGTAVTPDAVAKDIGIDPDVARRALDGIAARGAQIRKTDKGYRRRSDWYGRPLALAEFLAANGGIQDQGGELAAMDLGTAFRFVPKIGPLIRANGMKLDEARRLAGEAGYLGANQEDATGKTDIGDLLDALDREARAANAGDWRRRVWSTDDTGEVLDHLAERERDRDEIRDDVRQRLEARAAAVGIDVNPDWDEETLLAEVAEAILDLDAEAAARLATENWQADDDLVALDESAPTVSLRAWLAEIERLSGRDTAGAGGSEEAPFELPSSRQGEGVTSEDGKRDRTPTGPEQGPAALGGVRPGAEPAERGAGDQGQAGEAAPGGGRDGEDAAPREPEAAAAPEQPAAPAEPIVEPAPQPAGEPATAGAEPGAGQRGLEEPPAWWRDLTRVGRQRAFEAVGFSPARAERLSKVAWHNLKQRERDLVEKARAAKPDQAPKPLEEMNRGAFRAALEKTGSARYGGADYVIAEASGGGFYYRRTQDGQRIEKGGGYPAKWSRETAIDRAVDEAFPPIEPPKAAPAPAAAKPVVSPNRIFTDEAAEKALAILKKKSAQLNVGLDPEAIQAGITLAGWHIEHGFRTFAAYSKAMIEKLGEQWRPYLRSFYEAVRHYPGFDNSGMSTAAEIDAAEAEAAASTPTEAPSEPAEPSGQPAAKPPGADLFGERDIYPDGRWKPAEGDKVYTMRAGFAGSGVHVSGEVYRAGSGGLRVRITGSAGMFNEISRQRTVPLTEDWTVVGDPRPEQMRQEREDRERERDERYERERREEQDAARARVAEAIGRGDTALTADVRMGTVVRDHLAEADMVIAERGDDGTLYAARLDEPNEGARSFDPAFVTVPAEAATPEGHIVRVGRYQYRHMGGAKPWARVEWDEARDDFVPVDDQRFADVPEPGREEAPAAPSAAGGKAGPAPAGSGVLRIEPFGDRFIIVRGQTRENMDRIKAVGGARWNRGGQGWTFFKDREADVRKKLADLLGGLAKPVESRPEPAKPDEQRPPRPFTVDDIGKEIVAKPGTGWPDGYRRRISRGAEWSDEQKTWMVRTDGPTVRADEFELAPSQPAAATPAPATASAPAAEDEKSAAAGALSERIAHRLLRYGRLTNAELNELGVEHFGRSMAEGGFDRKDLYDALELGINKFIRQRASQFDPGGSTAAATVSAEALREVLSKVPTQTVRSDEQVSFQQFSTPPDYAFAAAWVADIGAGELVLEPSAGTGNLAVHALNAGARVWANELSPRRRALVESLGVDRVTGENAEQISNIFAGTERPTTVIMNPPFSQTAGRMGDRKVLETALVHIDQALKLLAPGGRLVAIVGQTFGLHRAAGRAIWDRISRDNAVRANIGVDGSVYAKNGTTFGTRILVIDKIAPDGQAAVTAEVKDIPALISALAEVRDARAEIGAGPRAGAVQPGSAQPGGQAPAAPDQGGRGPARGSVPPAAGAVGAGPERAGGEPGPAATRPAGSADRPDAGLERPGGGGEIPGAEPGRRPSGAAGSRPAGEPRGGGEPGTSGIAAAGEPAGPPAGGRGAGLPEAAGASPVEALDVGEAAPEAADQPISEAVYEPYRPQRLSIPGAQPHPGELVQSAAMASVEPPKPTYKPRLPDRLIKDGGLSLAQIEAIVYAGQAHEQMLPAGEGEIAQRRGFFIGDGTGVGKGREVSGIILDNWNQGRKKAVWVSEKAPLVNDARRDWTALGGQKEQIFELGKVKAGNPITAGQGILFTTYDTLKGGLNDASAAARGQFVRGQKVRVVQTNDLVTITGKGQKKTVGGISAFFYPIQFEDGTRAEMPAAMLKKEEGGEAKIATRVDQIVDWLGKDFDGVIAFDEAHNMANAIQQRGKRGTQEAAAKALAGIDLQQKLPNARIVYVSATGATEVSNLAYAERLGLWGRGTAFPAKNQFISEISSGGIAAMELVARDLKAMGSYLARSLSFNGVEYDRLEHTLTPQQREIYDDLATAWQNVLRNIDDALRLIGAVGDDGRTLNSRAKSAALSAFWGAHQRFFNQIITSMQMPTVLEAVERDIAAGRQAVLQLVNTNEASQERAAAKAETAEDLQNLDITPRDQLIQLIEGSFPVQQQEQYVDADGNLRSRPVEDSEGNPVLNPEAVALRDELIERVSAARVPQGPIDMLLDRFGIDQVAEVTGRKRRFVMKPDPKTGVMTRQEDVRPSSANIAEADLFQRGEKKILVFSNAGGTGRSYHADNSSPSRDARRSHYLVQAGWRADTAIQGFGRTHRTNQASAPIFHLATTDIPGQKRFISSIARRLGQLGALTKGQRQTGDQGVFSAADNLESSEARDSLRRFFADLHAGQIEGMTIGEFQQQTGLRLVDPSDGGLFDDLPDITQFLNRLLSLRLDAQRAVMEAFDRRLQGLIEAKREAGTLDIGLETVTADRTAKRAERTVYTDPASGAETRHVEITLSHKNHPIPFDRIRAARGHAPLFFVQSMRGGNTYAVTEAPNRTNSKTGDVDLMYRLVGPVESHPTERRKIDGRDAAQHWRRVTDQAEARRLWDEQVARTPEFRTETMNLITGAVLPVWDRLPKTMPRIVRLQTDAGERFLGRVVPNDQIADTLARLGATSERAEVTPEDAVQRILDGTPAQLANDWTIKRATVAGERRIEIVGVSSFGEGQQLRRDGVFSERIQYETRYFIPTGDDAAKVFAAVTKFRPVARWGNAPAAPKAGGTRFQRARMQRPAAAPAFFSALTRGVEAIGTERAPAAQWAHTIRNLTAKGVKQDEIDWSGVIGWLSEQKGPVAKADLLAFLRANEVKVEEVTKGGVAVPDIKVERRADADGEFWIVTSNGHQVAGGFDTKEYADEAAREAREEAEFDAGVPEGAETKFGTYVLPGGENYRELLLTLPARPAVRHPDLAAAEAFNKKMIDKYGSLSEAFNRMTEEENTRFADLHSAASEAAANDEPASTPDARDYRSPHFDEPNVLAHVRFNERVDAEGRRVLFIEEIQSDWHQAGRREGYLTRESMARDDARLAEMAPDIERLEQRLADSVNAYMRDNDRAAFDARQRAIHDELAPLQDERIRIIDRRRQGEYGTGVPDAPLKTQWPEFALKRMLRYAAENGFDRVAWTTGDQQEQRYWGNELVAPAVRRWIELSKPDRAGKQLSDYIGRELAAMPPLKIVDSSVLSSLENDQVRKAVVQAIPVDVMDVLAENGLTPEQLFRNDDVVSNALTINDRATVARGLAGALQLVGARLRAALHRVLASEAAGRDEEVLPAVRASDLNPHVVMGLLSPLGRGNLLSNVEAPPIGDTGTRDRAEPAVAALGGNLAGVAPKLSTTQLAEALNRHADIVARRTGKPVEYVQPPPGEGMRGFYDRMLPSIANKLGKKWGAKVGTAEVATEIAEPPLTVGVAPPKPATARVHSIDVTPAMRASVMQGQPLWRRGERGKSGQGPAPASAQRPVPGVRAESRPATSPADADRIAELRRTVFDLARRVAPGLDVETFNRLVEEADAQAQDVYGAYAPRWSDGVLRHLAVVSLSARGPGTGLASAADVTNTIGHEAIHFLRAIGVIEDREWAALEKRATQSGLSAAEVDAMLALQNRVLDGEKLTKPQQAQLDRLEARASWLERYDIAARYPDATREQQIEEAIAEAYGEYAAQRATMPPGFRRIFEKIKALLDRLADWLEQKGWNRAADWVAQTPSGSVERVMSRIDRGAVGAREPGAELNEEQRAILELIDKVERRLDELRESDIGADPDAAAEAERLYREAELLYEQAEAMDAQRPPRSETIDTIDGPRDQFLIPGAERREALRGPKRAAKPQARAEGLPLFGGQARKDEPQDGGQGTLFQRGRRPTATAAPPGGVQPPSTPPAGQPPQGPVPQGSGPSVVRGTPEQEAAIAKVLAPPDDRSLIQRARDWLTDIREDAGRRFTQAVFDQFHSLKAAEQDQFGGPLDASVSAYEAALRTQSLDSVMSVVLRNNPLRYNDQSGAFERLETYADGSAARGFIDIFEPLARSGLLHLWKGYAVARRAQRLIQEGRERILDQADIDALLALRREHPEFEDVFHEWQKFNRAMLDMAEASGLINAQQRALFERQDYIPFYRVMDDGGVAAPGKKAGLANQRSGIRTLKGGEAQIGDVIENMVLNMTKLVDASFKNVAARRMVALLDGTGAISRAPMDFEKVYGVTADDAATALEDLGIQVTGTNMTNRDAAVALWQMRPPRDPDVIHVMIDGKARYYRVHDDLLLRSVTALRPEQTNAIIQLFGGAKRLLTFMVTLDPGFMARNAVRDTLSAAIQTTERKLIPGVDSAKGFAAAMKEDPALLDIMAAGGGSGGFYATTPAKVRRELERRLSPDDRSRIIDGMVRAKDAYLRIGQASEAANRIAIYNAAIKDGATRAQAVSEAQDLLNFSMRGDHAAVRFLVAVVPFMNARLQGLYKLGRAGAVNPKGMLLRGAILTAATMALMGANWDDDEYWDLEEWDRDAYYHLKIAGQWWRLPKPFEIGAIFSTIPERMAAYAKEGREDLLARSMGKMLMDTFALNPMPQLVKPVYEQLANKNFFFDRPIVGQSLERLQPGAQSTPFTSDTLRELGEALNLSPVRMEHVVRGYLGTLGTYMLAATDTAVRFATDAPPRPETAWSRVPVVGSFFRGEAEGRRTRWEEEFYGFRREADAVYSTIKRARELGDDKTADTLQAAEAGKLGVRPPLNRIEKVLQGIRREERQVYADRAMAPAEKRTRLDELQRRRTEVTRRVDALRRQAESRPSP